MAARVRRPLKITRKGFSICLAITKMESYKDLTTLGLFFKGGQGIFGDSYHIEEIYII